MDVRVIAATNRDLAKAVKAGAFRQDLYYRLNVFPIDLPPLREREGDVALLVKFLVAKFAQRIGRRIESVDGRTLARLKGYRWPGNVRELENVLERAVILSSGGRLEIDPKVLEWTPAATAEAPRSGEEVASGGLEDVERSHILAVLRRTNWVIEGPRGAATVLDLHPNTLRSRLKRLGISKATHGAS